MRYIDLDTWKRRGHYEFFHRMDYPQYNICVDIDVSNFKEFTTQNGLSFYYSMIFAATTAINQIENFRYRIRDDKVVLHDRIHPSFTDMNKNGDDDLFKMVSVELTGDIHEFVKNAKQTSEQQKDYFGMDQLVRRDDVIYITCIPWISFTHVSHTITLNRNDAVPRISWGKYFKQGDRMLLPFSVQSHHSFVDGYHVGRYIDALQSMMDGMK